MVWRRHTELMQTLIALVLLSSKMYSMFVHFIVDFSPILIRRTDLENFWAIFLARYDAKKSQFLSGWKLTFFYGPFYEKKKSYEKDNVLLPLAFIIRKPLSRKEKFNRSANRGPFWKLSLRRHLVLGKHKSKVVSLLWKSSISTRFQLVFIVRMQY